MAKNTALIERVAETLSKPPAYAPDGGRDSILVVAAGSYGAQTSDTQPTGFDAEAAALFEALVESAYLVATADHEFDAMERAAFQHVVVSACGSHVRERQVGALLADLHDQLEEDGLARRVERIGESVTKLEHKQEVLRVGALMAHISSGINEAEQRVLHDLERALGLGASELEAAIAEAERVISE